MDNESRKKIKLDIIFKTGKNITASSDNLGKKFHLMESNTPSCLINDTFTITRGISKYTRKYDVEYEYSVYKYIIKNYNCKKCLIL